jgi:hypothetical protein
MLWPLDRDLVVALVGGHLALHRVHVGDRAVVEILAPDEGRDLLQELLPGREVAGAGRALIIAARSQFCPVLS